MARALLAGLGPREFDMTATRMDRRRELEERIARLESEVDEQLALLPDGEVSVATVETDDGPVDVPLALFSDGDLERV